MRGALPLARIAGIRITVDPSWFVIFLLVAYSVASGYLPERFPAAGAATLWLAGAVLAAALFASVLAHELAHALVARGRSVEVDEIMLFIFGGVAKLRGEPRDARSELMIAAAGPALSLALGIGLLGLSDALPLPPLARVGVRWLGAINIALALFNLVPGFPLDGGRILRAILWWRMGDFERATVAAARTGQVFAVFLIGAGVVLTGVTGRLSYLWEVLIGWFLWSAAARSIRIARLRDAVEGVAVRDFMTDRVPAIRADQDLRVGLAQASVLTGATELAVIERDGTLVGVVTADQLAREAETDARRPARGIARAADPEQLLDPGAPAEEIVARLAGIAGRLLLVVEDGALLGTIDPRALVAALRDRQP